MRIVFFGTSDSAAQLLEALYKKYEIATVVTAVDKKKGRGRKISSSSVKALAQKLSLSLLQPEILKDPAFLKTLQEANASVFVVCSYGKILPKEVLQIPKRYTINLHTSLLPKYRGAAPINWAIINGECESGITIFKINERMDQGEVILQKKAQITTMDTSETLAKKLTKIGISGVLETLDLIAARKEKLSVQDEGKVSLAPKLCKNDGLIDWNSSAVEIHNRVRGLQPWPGAFTYLKDKLLKVCKTKVVAGDERVPTGTIIAIDKSKGITVQTKRDQLLLTDIQIEGKRKMSASAFIAGHTLTTGMRLGKK